MGGAERVVKMWEGCEEEGGVWEEGEGCGRRWEGCEEVGGVWEEVGGVWEEMGGV